LDRSGRQLWHGAGDASDGSDQHISSAIGANEDACGEHGRGFARRRIGFREDAKAPEMPVGGSRLANDPQAGIRHTYGSTNALVTEKLQLKH
jgi:hypothetical protein